MYVYKKWKMFSLKFEAFFFFKENMLIPNCKHISFLWYQRHEDITFKQNIDSHLISKALENDDGGGGGGFIQEDKDEIVF